MNCRPLYPAGSGHVKPFGGHSHYPFKNTVRCVAALRWWPNSKRSTGIGRGGKQPQRVVGKDTPSPVSHVCIILNYSPYHVIFIFLAKQSCPLYCTPCTALPVHLMLWTSLLTCMVSYLTQPLALSITSPLLSPPRIINASMHVTFSRPEGEQNEKGGAIEGEGKRT